MCLLSFSKNISESKGGGEIINFIQMGIVDVAWVKCALNYWYCSYQVEKLVALNKKCTFALSIF